MKTMDRLYERLTPEERFQIAVAAFGRGDLAEVDRLNDSTPWRTVKIQDPAYFDRLQRITWLSLYVGVVARNQQAAAFAAFAAMVLHTMRTADRDDGDADADDPEFGEMCDLCAERMSRVKALHSAWETFCAGLGVTASDIDKMTGLPLVRPGGDALELIEEILGEIPTDEDYQQQCLDHMTAFWQTRVKDRHPG